MADDVVHRMIMLGRGQELPRPHPKEDELDSQLHILWLAEVAIEPEGGQILDPPIMLGLRKPRDAVDVLLLSVARPS